MSSISHSNLIVPTATSTSTDMDTLGLLIISSIPTVIGVTQALRYKEQAAEQEKQGPKWFNLVCVSEDTASQFYGAKIALLDKQLLIDTNAETKAFLFKGLFHDYLGTDMTGLVSYIDTDPPALNWIYVENEKVKYGTGSESKGEGKKVGPWSYKGGLQLQDEALFYVGEELGDGKWELRYGENGKKEGLKISMATVSDS
ncbi:hypothetical protein H072_8313 [Dactylellina haptotyla CBS 200.50]|uniref:Uncharacterized protein n=1 Tax=Dactylellina haptotyla (strain CBS 200.50) TaxID=1284197 RepID=S8A4P2_DACHA|nr:hypothetical protein H072_8313 [Dactylellina haptotyla CBS 200.50]